MQNGVSRIPHRSYRGIIGNGIWVLLLLCSTAVLYPASQGHKAPNGGGIFSSTPPYDTSLTFSEVMFYSAPGNNEFVELFNLSDTRSFDLAGYKIQYESAAPDIIRGAGFGTVLGPRSYAIIFENDYDSLNGIYSSLIPPGALVLKISSNAFGSNGMANTADRTLRLLRPNADTIESYTYSAAGHKQGFSDEKMLMNKNNNAGNWGISKQLNGTPGAKNTCTPPIRDLQLTSFTVLPDSFAPGDAIVFRAAVMSNGSDPAGNYMLKIYRDTTGDTSLIAGDLLYQNGGPLLQYRDSTIFIIPYTEKFSGSIVYTAKLYAPDDEDTTNNILRIRRVTTPPEKLMVRISEIMYAPPAGNPEWIELYNPAATPVSLKNARIGDAITMHTITKNISIGPGGYIILCSDSSITRYYPLTCPLLVTPMPVFNNDMDAVVLYNPDGTVADSLYYLAAWGGQGGSLEKKYIDSSSVTASHWGSCIAPAKGTPGKRNSITPPDYNLSLTGFTVIPSTAILNSTVFAEISVSNTGMLTPANCFFDLYIDSNGDSLGQASELLESRPFTAPAPGASVHLSAPLPLLAAGTYTIIASLHSEQDTIPKDNSRVSSLRIYQTSPATHDIIINEIMYAPPSGESEWVELYNKGTQSIDLCKYRFSDGTDTAAIPTRHITIAPGSFAVICADTNQMKQYTISVPLIGFTMPTLNNSGDKAVLLDSLGRVIDSLAYSPHQGGSGGYSLERVYTDSASTDSANWRQAKPGIRATPGRVNSVSPKMLDLVLSMLSAAPQYPQPGDTCTLTIHVRNAGLAASPASGVHISVRSAGSILADAHLPVKTMSRGDSTQVLFPFIMPADSAMVSAVADTLQDDDYTNNTGSLIVYAPSRPGSLIINEIMAAPAEGMPEWVELYNASTRDIDLRGWEISDCLGSPVSAVITRLPAVVHAGGYCIIARDSVNAPACPNKFIAAFGSLQNTADGVVVYDNHGFTVIVWDTRQNGRVKRTARSNDFGFQAVLPIGETGTTR